MGHGEVAQFDRHGAGRNHRSLLLCVFAIVNVACLVLGRDRRAETRFRAPTALPVIGAIGCALLAGPWARPEDWIQYRIAAALLCVG